MMSRTSNQTRSEDAVTLITISSTTFRQQTHDKGVKWIALGRHSVRKHGERRYGRFLTSHWYGVDVCLQPVGSHG